MLLFCTGYNRRSTAPVAIQRRTFSTGSAEQASQTADAPPGRDERQQQSERWFGRPPS